MQYADDTVFYVEGYSIDDITLILQQDLNTLVDYCDKKQLTINASKTKSMLYTYEENKVLGNLEVKGKQLEVDFYKYLGVTLESDLTF